MLLKRKQRERVRGIARNHYRWNTVDIQNISRNEPISQGMLRTVRGRRESMAAGIREDLGKGFGTGIIASILISIAIKLAMKYINQWIEDRFFGWDVPSEFSEVK